MAGKLLKHFGLGRKTPPHPPKADYTTQKSTSVQELLPKSPPSERSTVSLSATTSHIGDLDRTGSGSPAHKTSDKSLFGGARPKDSGSSSGFSPKQSVSERHSIISIGGEDGAVGGQGSEGADGAAKSKKVNDRLCDCDTVSQSHSDSFQCFTDSASGHRCQTQSVLLSLRLSQSQSINHSISLRLIVSMGSP